ncbi:MAG: hypothetical protein PHR82_07560 [Endomicrobiaceae bacterium]|nr:hypothetical protein [Endomicrobiaceae bacterium]
MKTKNEIHLFFQDIKDLFVGLYKYLQQNFSFIYFIFAIIHFIVTFYTDPLIFEYADTDIGRFVLIKRIFLIVIVLLWQFIGILVKNYSRSEMIRNFIRFSVIYFLIMSAVHILLWPFIVGDQMYYSYFANSVYFSDRSYFQGVFIRYFRIYSLMLIPNLGGIILMQVLTISLILGYIIAVFKSYFKLDKSIYFFYIPFLMPLVIQYNLHMEKDILYSYFFMLLFAKLMFIQLQSKSINVTLFNIAIITSVTASLRSEGILLFVAIPVMLYLLNYKILKLRNMILFLLLSVCCSFVFIPHYVSSVILDKDGKSYKNVYILNDSFKDLLKKAVEDKNKYILDEFNNTHGLKIAQILNNSIDNAGFYRSLSESDRKQFEIVKSKLMRTYFGEFVKFKFNAFYNKLLPENLTTNLHDLKSRMDFSIQCYNTIKDKIVNLNPQLYSDTIQLLRQYNSNIIKHFKNSLSVWYIFLYFLLFVGVIFYKLKKIFIIVCFLVIFLIIQILIVPSPGFRFFFQCYLAGYMSVFYLIFHFISAKKYKTE